MTPKTDQERKLLTLAVLQANLDHRYSDVTQLLASDEDYSAIIVELIWLSTALLNMAAERAGVTANTLIGHLRTLLLDELA